MTHTTTGGTLPDALRNLLHDAEFSRIEVEACGDVFLSAFDMVRPYVRAWLLGRLVRMLGLILAMLVTRLSVRIGKAVSARGTPSSCPNGIWFVAMRGSGK